MKNDCELLTITVYHCGIMVSLETNMAEVVESQIETEEDTKAVDANTIDGLNKSVEMSETLKLLENKLINNTNDKINNDNKESDTESVDLDLPLVFFVDNLGKSKHVESLEFKELPSQATNKETDNITYHKDSFKVRKKRKRRKNIDRSCELYENNNTVFEDKLELDKNDNYKSIESSERVGNRRSILLSATYDINSLDGGKSFKCNLCDAHFIRRSNLNKHLSDLHEETKPYRCGECSYKGKSLNNLKDHSLRRHQTEKTIKCELCDYSCTTLTYLKSHYSHKHNKTRPFQCSQCSFSAKTANSLRQHIGNQHNELKRNQCSFCDYSCQFPCDLRKHIMRRHTDSKPYPCSKCDYSAKTVHSLKIHISTRHEDKRPFACPYCDQTYKTATTLRQHKFNIHSNQRPHTCPYCLFAFKTMSHLRRHAASKHGDTNVVTLEKMINTNGVSEFKTDMINTHGVNECKSDIARLSNDKLPSCREDGIPVSEFKSDISRLPNGKSPSLLEDTLKIESSCEIVIKSEPLSDCESEGSYHTSH